MIQDNLLCTVSLLETNFIVNCSMWDGICYKYIMYKLNILEVQYTATSNGTHHRVNYNNPRIMLHQFLSDGGEGEDMMSQFA